MCVHVYRAGIKLATFRLKTHYCLSPSRDIPTWNKEWSRKKTSTGTRLHSGEHGDDADQQLGQEPLLQLPLQRAPTAQTR